MRARSRTPTLHARCVVRRPAGRRARAADLSFPWSAQRQPVHGAAGHIEQARACHFAPPARACRVSLGFNSRAHGRHCAAVPCRRVLQGQRELVKNLWLGEQCSKTTVDAAPLFESDSGFPTRRVNRRTGVRLHPIHPKVSRNSDRRTHQKRNIRVHDDFSRRLSRREEHACKFSPFPSSQDHRIFDRSAGSAIQRLQNPSSTRSFAGFLWANETKKCAKKRETKKKGTSR